MRLILIRLLALGLFASASHACPGTSAGNFAPNPTGNGTDRVAYAGNVNFFGQTFVAAQAGPLLSIDVVMRANGSGPSNLTMKVWPVVGGLPTGLPAGTPLAVATLSTTLPGAYQTVSFDFANAGLTLQQGASYCWTITSDAGDAGYDLRGTTNPAAYADGAAVSYHSGHLASPPPPKFIVKDFLFAAHVSYCAADFNNSGVLSVQDLFDFLAAYFAADPRADFNGSGTISVQDIFDFLFAWFAGSGPGGCACAAFTPDYPTLAAQYAAGANVDDAFLLPFCFGQTRHNGPVAPGSREQALVFLQMIPNFLERAVADLNARGAWGNCVNFSFATPCDLYDGAARSLYGSPYAWASFINNGLTLTQSDVCLRDLQPASGGTLTGTWFSTDVLSMGGAYPVLSRAQSPQNDFRLSSSLFATGGTARDGTVLTASAAIARASETNLVAVAQKLQDGLFSTENLLEAGVPQAQINYVKAGRRPQDANAIVLRVQETADFNGTVGYNASPPLVNIPYLNPAVFGPPLQTMAFTLHDQLAAGEISTTLSNTVKGDWAHDYPPESQFLTGFASNVGQLPTDSAFEQFAAFEYSGGVATAPYDPVFPQAGPTVYGNHSETARTAYNAVHNTTLCTADGAPYVAWQQRCSMPILMDPGLVAKWTNTGGTNALVATRDGIFPPVWSQFSSPTVSPTGMDLAAGLTSGVLTRIAQALGDHDAWLLNLRTHAIMPDVNTALEPYALKFLQAAQDLWGTTYPMRVEVVKRQLLMANLPVVLGQLPSNTMNSIDGGPFAGPTACQNSFTGSTRPATQPAVNAQQPSVTAENWFTNCYTGFVAANPAYLTVKLSYFSRNNFMDQLVFWDNSGTYTSGVPDRNGVLQYAFNNSPPPLPARHHTEKLSDTTVFINSSAVRWAHLRILAPGTLMTYQQWDDNPLGYMINAITPHGFAVNPGKVAESASHVTIDLDSLIVDPSASLLNTTHSYLIQIDVSDNQSFTYTKTTASALGTLMLPKHEAFKVQVTRAANAQTGGAVSTQIFANVDDIGQRDFAMGLLPGGQEVPSVVH